jgi:acetate kinase
LQAPGDVHTVGHRVVHGGERYTTAVRITPEVKQAIDALAELAPLHNPARLAGINAVEQVLPRVPQVAVFDTAFHATLSWATWAWHSTAPSTMGASRMLISPCRPRPTVSWSSPRARM